MCAEHLTFFPFENIDLKGREHKNVYFVTLAIKITDKNLKWGHRNKKVVFRMELWMIIFLIFSWVVFWKIKMKFKPKWSLAILSSSVLLFTLHLLSDYFSSVYSFYFKMFFSPTNFFLCKLFSSFSKNFKATLLHS